jgi:sulfatase maturation enzyme AslB (radical SAM superfamily)
MEILMRTIAFGYSTRCNIRCEHCVAADDHKPVKMEFERAKDIIDELGAAGVGGISFTAGEPLLYPDEIAELIGLCAARNIYTRVVTNSFWGKSREQADQIVGQFKQSGICQFRLSFSRWHQKNVAKENVLRIARSCVEHGVDYFISFVTDFSQKDDPFESFLRKHKLKFFPEPVIYSGRAAGFESAPLRTDYHANCCPMNPYLAPTGDLYACCDAGSHFSRTNFFHLGHIRKTALADLLHQSEENRLYNHIRTMGISTLASFAGFKARDIIRYRKCELCEKLFNDQDVLKGLVREADTGLMMWSR